jgi:hypothetical protein
MKNEIKVVGRIVLFGADLIGRTEEEILEIEKQVNQNCSIVTTYTGVIPLKVLIEKYQKLGLKKGMIRHHLFTANITKKRLYLLREDKTSTPLVFLRQSTERLDDAVLYLKGKNRNKKPK